MDKLIALDEYPVRPVLDKLLKDKTTRGNIIWATETYAALGAEYAFSANMQVNLLTGLFMGSAEAIIRPRTRRSREDQAVRTRKKAEVFTPVWICNRMNNFSDAEWFGRPDVFNIEDGTTWTTIAAPIAFPDKRSWKKYVDSRRLEITCGEAPFIVSRYDAATGALIPLADRIGILDRKLRIVNENTTTAAEWHKWTIRAFQSVYGYEYQGDSLLIARANLVHTYGEHYAARWDRPATKRELGVIANIVAWNFWQMNGLTAQRPARERSLALFASDADPQANVCCRIYDWRSEKSLNYSEMKKGRKS